jgi:long-chain acyl-CoA synthetase
MSVQAEFSKNTSPANQTAEVLKGLPAHISEIVNGWAKRSPGRTVLVEASGTWTYRQMAAAVAETEVWLRDLGVRPGDRVMVVGENCRMLVALFLAVVGMDAWPVLVNARLSPPEIDRIRDHCGARRLIYTVSVSPHAHEHAARHGAVTDELSHLGPVRVGLLNEEVRPEAVEPDPAQRIAALVYTSGTTGVPKGFMLTNRNLIFAAATAAKIRSLTPNDRLYGVLPMSHVVGLSAVLLATLLSGASLYLSPRFDPMKARATLERDRITVMLGVPTTYGQFLEYAKLRKLASLDCPELRIISCSGAPLHPAMKSATEKLFGLVLHNGYGVTESSPNVAQTRIESPRTDTSVGPVIPGVEVRLVGADKVPVLEGEVGELWVRGPNIMKGYYRAPAETRAVLDQDGWLNTQDLARLERGNLFIVGRAKDLVIRFGFNVYPAEIEAVLNTRPEVVRSAVIGRPIEGTGEEDIVAFVEVAPGSSVNESTLLRYAAERLAFYKQPSKIYLVSEMPLTATGKVLKHELAKRLPNHSPA